MVITKFLTVDDVNRGPSASNEPGLDGVLVVVIAFCDEVLTWDGVSN